jgi:hypothetical protein
MTLSIDAASLAHWRRKTLHCYHLAIPQNSNSIAAFSGDLH